MSEAKKGTFNKIKAGGFRLYLGRKLKKISRAFGVESEIVAAKNKVDAHVRKSLSDTIGYGPFAGMKLDSATWWGGSDTTSKLLGEYEAHIADWLVSNRDPGKTFVNIGAADGYFAIGAVKAGLFDKAVCFEISSKGREALARNAKLNGVGEKIQILGLCDEQGLINSVAQNGTCIILCDIEGGEFDLFTDTVLSNLKNCSIAIELHTFKPRYGTEAVRDLETRAGSYFELEWLAGANPRVHDFEELSDFSDDHRMLAFSEGRPKVMEWMTLTPAKLQ